MGVYSNINAFHDSLIYFSIDYYKKEHCQDFMSDSKAQTHTFNKAALINKIISLYWPTNSVCIHSDSKPNNLIDPIGGILDISSIIISGILNELQVKQRSYILNYEKDLRMHFRDLKRLLSPKNSYQLLCWADIMINEFFGGFIRLNISTQKNTKPNSDKYYYVVSIDQSKYIELLLNKNSALLPKTTIAIIKNYFGEIMCCYSDLHGCNTIKELCNSNPNDEF